MQQGANLILEFLALDPQLLGFAHFSFQLLNRLRVPLGVIALTILNFVGLILQFRFEMLDHAVFPVQLILQFPNLLIQLLHLRQLRAVKLAIL